MFSARGEIITSFTRIFVDDLCGGAWYRDKLEERFSLYQAKKTYSSRLFWISSI